MKVDVKEFRLKLYPKDFQLVKNFYEKDLGFRILEEWDNGELNKGVMFQAGQAVLELLSPKNGFKVVSGADVSWEVINVRELWESWKDRPNVIFALRDNSWGDTSFCISDPEGFKISFFTKHSKEIKDK